MSLNKMLAILRARWVAMVTVLCLTVGLVVGITLLMTKKYSATASVVLDVKSPDPIAGMVLQGMATSGYMATQVDIIQSNRIARRVVSDLKLSSVASMRANWKESTDGAGDFEEWLAELVKTQLTVKPARDSNVVHITYTAPDPKFAATMANAFVKAYIDTTVDLRVSPAKQYSDFFDSRAKDARDRFEKAQAKLSNYQKEHAILATDERLDIETQRLNELNSQLVALQSVTAESVSRSAQARSAPNQLQDVINNPVVAGLRADESRLKAKLQELNSRLGPANPQVIDAEANLSELTRRIQEETRRVSSSVSINSTISRGREAEVRSSLENQRAKVLRMREQRDEVAVLMRDVETAQKAYETINARLNQTNLERQSDQTNISILTNAYEPSSPSSPRLLLNSIVAVVLGLLLAPAIALLLESFSPRIRTDDDITEVIGIPVLGHLPRFTLGQSETRSSQLMLPQNMVGQISGPKR